MRNLIVLMMLTASILAPAFALAQEEGPDLNLNPSLAQASQAARAELPKTSVMAPLEGKTPWGTQRGGKWIAASQFTVRLSSAAPTLTYAGNHFYSSPGSASPTRYFAQLDVEPGALVDLVTCVYNDSSAANNVTFQLQKYTTNVSTGSSTSVILDSFTTSGSGGVGFDFLEPSPAVTMSTTDGVLQLFNYYIAADVASDTSIAGCWAFWKHQVAPGPATASFTDVPTSSPYFKFVEALVATGVTSGCGGGNYCPDNPITRGQMAVFLAASLGMGFPF
jgi:hypothetical protein